MPKQPYVNAGEDAAIKKQIFNEIKNAPLSTASMQPVKSTSNNVGSTTTKSRAVKSTAPTPSQITAQSTAGGTYTGTSRVITSDAGVIIIDTDKDVFVNTYEETVEQKYITNGTDGSVNVGTVAGTTFNGVVENTSKLGFDILGGFTVTDLGTGTAKVSLTGGGSVLTQNVEVIGTNLGAVDAGYVFPVGMTFTDFVMTISQKTIPPTYTAPTLSLAASPSPTTTEIGTIISPLFNRVFYQNDGGAISANRLYKNSVLLSSSFPYTDSGVQLTDTATVYQAQADYAQGPVKNNNMGIPDPSGQIPAGTVSSNTLTYIGSRVSFYGTPLSTPNSSTTVRAMSGQSFNTANNPDVNAAGEDLVPNPSPNYTITIPIGATRVCFAYPDTSRDVASVRYQELSFSEVKDNFTQTTVVVAGANGYSPVAYRVYTYVPVEPFSQEVHYLVFI